MSFNCFFFLSSAFFAACPITHLECMSFLSFSFSLVSWRLSLTFTSLSLNFNSSGVNLLFLFPCTFFKASEPFNRVLAIFNLLCRSAFSLFLSLASAIISFQGLILLRYFFSYLYLSFSLVQLV